MWRLFMRQVELAAGSERGRSPIQKDCDWRGVGLFEKFIHKETAIARDRVLLSIRTHVTADNPRHEERSGCAGREVSSKRADGGSHHFSVGRDEIQLLAIGPPSRPAAAIRRDLPFTD